MTDNVTLQENSHIIDPDDDNEIVPATRAAAGLSGRQLRAIPLIVVSPTIREAAKTLEISERTIYRWLQEPDFHEELVRQRNLAAELALQQIRGLLDRTAPSYVELMRDPDSSIRLRATNAVSTLGYRINEGQNLLAKLEELEQAFEELKAKNPLA